MEVVLNERVFTLKWCHSLRAPPYFNFLKKGRPLPVCSQFETKRRRERSAGNLLLYGESATYFVEESRIITVMEGKHVERGVGWGLPCQSVGTLALAFSMLCPACFVTVSNISLEWESSTLF